MTTEQGLSMETDEVLRLMRENERLRAICFGLIEGFENHVEAVTNDFETIKILKQELENTK